MKRIIAAVVAGLVLLGCGVNAGSDPPPTTPAAPAAPEVPVVFDVTGPTVADITWGTGGDIHQDLAATVPWRKAITAAQPVIATLVAQSKGAGKITCQVTVDGVPKPPVTSEGQFAVVTCSS